MEYEKQPQTTTDAPVKIYQPQVKSVTVRQQTGFLDHAPVRIYEKPPKQQASPFPPAFQ
ncbi:unknown [Ruminococcus sp. CAG:254]|nr:unknown [Ruminococcus sp. CAG:254]